MREKREQEFNLPYEMKQQQDRIDRSKINTARAAHKAKVKKKKK